MRAQSFALALVAALAGCSGQPATRAVSGQLRVDTSAMQQPVVIAQSSDHRVFVASVTTSGRFTLQLPAGVGYRMTLASSTNASGVYSAAARINWPLPSGAARWAVVGDGAAIDLGQVYQRGTRPSGLGTACDSCGGSDGDHQGADGGDHGDGDHGDCHEDDHACGAEHTDVDDDCDHKVGTTDKCDKDDNADEHDKDADNDDHDKCNGDGGTSTGGGGAGGAGGGGGDLGAIK
jgi:hypothetical protein